MKRIGILGGTFNPIHNAHLHMAVCAKEQANLDEVWFMPTKNPPHKRIMDGVTEVQRSDMIRLAIKEYSGFLFSNFELRREGTTYTSDTLEQLVAEHPHNEFFFIMGGDSFFQLESWHEPEKILQLTSVLAIARNHVSSQSMENRKRELEKKYHANIQIIDMEEEDISSHEIRQEISEGNVPEKKLPSVVWDYILEHHLYKY